MRMPKTSRANLDVVVISSYSEFFGEEGITTGGSRGFWGGEWEIYFPSLERTCWIWRGELGFVKDFDEGMIRHYYNWGARAEAKKTPEYQELHRQEMEAHDEGWERMEEVGRRLEGEVDFEDLDEPELGRLKAMLRRMAVGDPEVEELLRGTRRSKRRIRERKSKITREAAEEALRGLEEISEGRRE